ncbi:MAG: DUF1080 domain-containing protein [Planctomycetota bacterium]
MIILSTPNVWGQNSNHIRQPAGLTTSEIDAGWLALFDGSTLFGWKIESDADWQVKNQSIVVTSGKPGLLRTTSQFDDFLLSLEFKSPQDTNSGIFIRTSPRPRNPGGDCYEVNLASAGNPFPTGSLVDLKRAAPVDHASLTDRWNHLLVSASGNELKIKLNDKLINQFTDRKSLGRGYIGLQLNAGEISFRNIKLKPVALNSMFNGTNLNGWKTQQKLDSEFGVTENGELKILGGRGQIESESEFADFIFSMKCKTNHEKLNSGVFFRCIPSQLMNGYESQIQNGFRDRDRTQPEDCGTGGIFRRKNARYVNADDLIWFSKTIVAAGPHVSVWVNGYQVVDWSDTRKPDPNPRRGRRLEKGSIIFQGHDPTTDILIKDIQAREIRSRR